MSASTIGMMQREPRLRALLVLELPAPDDLGGGWVEVDVAARCAWCASGEEGGQDRGRAG